MTVLTFENGFVVIDRERLLNYEIASFTAKRSHEGDGIDDEPGHVEIWTTGPVPRLIARMSHKVDEASLVALLSAKLGAPANPAA